MIRYKERISVTKQCSLTLSFPFPSGCAKLLSIFALCLIVHFLGHIKLCIIRYLVQGGKEVKEEEVDRIGSLLLSLVPRCVWWYRIVGSPLLAYVSISG